jgi:hypothetical protein
MSDVPADVLLSISALARLCGRDRATVVKCLKDVEPAEKKKKETLYRLDEAVPAIVAGADAEMDEAKLRKAQADAEMKEIALKRERGEVVEVKEVRAYAQALFRALHQRFAVRMPRDIAPQLYKAESPAQITEVLQREAGRIFNEVRDDHTRLL